MPEHLQHVNRALTKDERRLAAEIREGAEKDFPPKVAERLHVPSGIPQRIHDARKKRGLTRYQVGQIADVPSTVVRAVEQGEDVPVSQLHAVAEALGLAVELVEQTS